MKCFSHLLSIVVVIYNTESHLNWDSRGYTWLPLYSLSSILRFTATGDYNLGHARSGSLPKWIPLMVFSVVEADHQKWRPWRA